MVRAEGETLPGLFFETGGTGNAWYLSASLPLPLLRGAAPFWCVFLSARAWLTHFTSFKALG